MCEIGPESKRRIFEIWLFPLYSAGAKTRMHLAAARYALRKDVSLLNTVLMLEPRRTEPGAPLTARQHSLPCQVPPGITCCPAARLEADSAVPGALRGEAPCLGTAGVVWLVAQEPVEVGTPHPGRQWHFLAGAWYLSYWCLSFLQLVTIISGSL